MVKLWDDDNSRNTKYEECLFPYDDFWACLADGEDEYGMAVIGQHWHAGQLTLRIGNERKTTD